MTQPTDTQQEDELRNTSFRWLKTVQGFTPEATLSSLQELLSTQREQARQEGRDESWAFTQEFLCSKDFSLWQEWEAEYEIWERTSLKKGGKKDA